MNNDGYIYFLNDYIPKLTPIISRNMIKMGGGISRGLNAVSTQNQRCHQLLYLLGTQHFCLVHVHVYDTRC